MVIWTVSLSAMYPLCSVLLRGLFGLAKSSVRNRVITSACEHERVVAEEVVRVLAPRVERWKVEESCDGDGILA
jgi:hypothetical protein